MKPVELRFVDTLFTTLIVQKVLLFKQEISTNWIETRVRFGPTTYQKYVHKIDFYGPENPADKISAQSTLRWKKKLISASPNFGSVDS